MPQNTRGTGEYVVTPDGRILTRADLPSRDTKRWVSRRKAEVVAAVQGGLITLEEACERYRLSVEEYLSWQHAIARYGMDGLQIAHAHAHRHHSDHRPPKEHRQHDEHRQHHRH